VIEALGGVVVPIEYALCHVLAPEEYRGIFLEKDEVKLAFDFEVAQENPDAEFVTFGSHLLEQLMELAKAKPVSTVRYVVVDRLSVYNPEDKIRNFLGTAQASVSILKERPVTGLWTQFIFSTSYMSDEKEEETGEVWIDMLTCEPDSDMEKTIVFYEKEPLYNYPIPIPVNMFSAFKKAYAKISEQTEKEALLRVREDILKKEKERIKDYYEELQDENRKNLNRKGISDERIRELTLKSQALEAEKERQLREMAEKYVVKTHIVPEHGIIYAIPLIEYLVKITSRGAQDERVLYYNPVLKRFGPG
jgi:hypothetical protein